MKAPKSSTYDPRVDGTSQSMLSIWLECREMARLGIVRGLDSTHASKPLIFGALGHSAIAHALVSNRKTVNGLIRGVQDDLAHAQKEFSAEDRELTSTATDIKIESVAVLGKILPAYWSKWGVGDLKRDWLKIEEKFKLDLTMPDGASVPYVGKMDRVFQGKKTPHLVETKFKAQVSKNISDTLPLDTQIGAYSTALTEMMGEEPGEIIYDICRRPGLKQGQDESLVEYAKRCGDEAMKDEDHYFTRLEIHLDRHEKETHKFRLQKLVEEFYAWWKTTTQKDRDLGWNGSRCDQYGGCHFLPVCSRGDEASFRLKKRHHPEL
jgi:hypothetical protein